jgi:hypothetical protein
MHPFPRKVPPSTGIFYPWVAETLAERFGALVIQPEHRFYGESQPLPPPWSADDLELLTPQQALADTAVFIDARRVAHNCSLRPGPNYCPVVTFGGSYPGFLSAMMRLRCNQEPQCIFSGAVMMLLMFLHDCCVWSVDFTALKHSH